MQTVACVKFSEQSASRDYIFENLELSPGDFCVVDYEGEETTGIVANIEKRCSNCSGDQRPSPSILRKAAERDIENWHRLKDRERKALAICKQKARDHNLPMSVSCVHISERQNKITFNFTADRRIDFRELVKDLAATLKARIELWQIGVRDEAKKMGGFGICGCSLCCATWISDFKAVSIRMAKNQDLTLSPSKLSGLCGRLMCCIQYEDEQYRRMSDELPPLAALIETPDMTGHVIDRRLLGQWLSVLDKDGNVYKVLKSEIVRVISTPHSRGEDDNGPEDQVDVIPDEMDEEEESRLKQINSTVKAFDINNPAVVFAIRGGSPNRHPAALKREAEARKSAEDKNLDSRMAAIAPTEKRDVQACEMKAQEAETESESFMADGAGEEETSDAPDSQSDEEDGVDPRQERRSRHDRRPERRDERRGKNRDEQIANGDKPALRAERSDETSSSPRSERASDEEDRSPRKNRQGKRKKGRPIPPGRDKSAPRVVAPSEGPAPREAKGRAEEADVRARKRRRPGKRPASPPREG